MTQSQTDELIAQAPDLVREALGEISDEIMKAAAQAYVQSAESDSGKCKLSIPCKIVVDLAKSPPSYHAEASVSVSYKASSDELTMDDPKQPKLPGMGAVSVTISAAEKKKGGKL